MNSMFDDKKTKIAYRRIYINVWYNYTATDFMNLYV